MNIKKFIFSHLISSFVLFLACGNSRHVNEEFDIKSSPEVPLLDSTNKQSFNLFDSDKYILFIDKNESSLKSISGFIFHELLTDTLRLELFYYHNKPVKLKYTMFEDGGDAIGIGSFYFDNSGYVFANKLSYDYFDIVELFVGDNKILKYKKNGAELEVLKMNPEAGLYRESAAVKQLDDFMLILQDSSYTAPKPSIKSPPILQTLEEVFVYENPDTLKLVGKLSRYEQLIYLGNNRKFDVVNGKIWSWYYIANTKGLKGWIFGHPDCLGDFNDETSSNK